MCLRKARKLQHKEEVSWKGREGQILRGHTGPGDEGPEGLHIGVMLFDLCLNQITLAALKRMSHRRCEHKQGSQLTLLQKTR